MEYIVNRYKELLLAENSKHNLMSRRTIHSDLDMHIADCLQVLDYLEINSQKIIDIGSGAGFPGLVLAIYRPQAKITLLEADLKKSGFLKMVKKELHLENLAIVRQRAEKLGRDDEYRGCFDISMSRAVATINVMLEYSLPLIKVGGKVALWKGRNYQHELDGAKKALEKLGGKVADVHQYKLKEDGDRAIVIIRKEKTTPANYPRRVGIPVKRPL